MVKKSVGAVSALALFAGLSTAAFAQGAGSDERLRPGQNAAPSAQEATPGQKQMSPGQPGAQQRGERVQTQERSPGETKRQQAEQPDGKQPRRAEDSDRKQPQRAEQPDGKQRAEQPDRKQRAEQPDSKQRAEQPDRKQRAEQPDGKQRAEQPDGKQRAEQPDGKRRAGQPDADGKQRAEQPDSKQRADQPDSKQRQAERPDGKRLSEEKRTVVRERLRESGDIDRARVANVNFDISVGTRVPRDRVKLVTLPTVIVQEVPQYRGYLYFAVSDEIVIVEPDTYVVVEVIKLDGSKGRTARLTLSSSQRDVILSHVDRRADVRLGIGGISIGMDVPSTVELRAFPQVVVSEVPELRSYRYFVYDDEVAIVSPDDREVVLTISN